MKHLTTEIIINSTVEKVWNTFTDFESYKEWNPLIKQLKGERHVGKHIEITLHLDGQKPMVMKPKVLNHAPNSEFRWKGSLGVKGLFDGEHYFKFEQISANETRFIHGEKFTGILVWPIMAMIGKATAKGFNDMNLALKELCERV